jgi:DNA-binding transcriptional regulator GbsR (MarR family)
VLPASRQIKGWIDDVHVLYDFSDYAVASPATPSISSSRWAPLETTRRCSSLGLLTPQFALLQQISSSAKRVSVRMSFGSLTPPNSFALSDDVIGNIMDRTWKAQSTSPAAVDRISFEKDVARPHNRQRSRHHPYTRAESTNNGHLAQVKPRRAAAMTLSLPSDLKTASELIATIKASNHSISAEMQNAIVAEALKKKIRHRERCRVNQARYRLRQQKVESNIQEAIKRLQVEIEELEAKSNGSPRPHVAPPVWAQAADYFRHFQSFASAPRRQETTASTFLHGLLSPDVVSGLTSGVEAQLKQWKMFASCFDDIRLELKGLSQTSSDTLVTRTVTTVTMTSRTLYYAFPHLNSDGEGGAKGGVWSSLAARMLDQKLVLRGSVTFGWDGTSDRIVRLQTQTDVLTPLLKLLGSLQGVSSVFDKALITPDGRFV